MRQIHTAHKEEDKLTGTVQPRLFEKPSVVSQVGFLLNKILLTTLPGLSTGSHC